MLALIRFIANHLGMNELVDTVVAELGERLDLAVAALANADDSMSLTLTWDMVYDTEPKPEWDEYDGEYRDNGWPYRYNGDHTDYYGPYEITIGKAELLTMAAGLKVIRAFLYRWKVYDLTLPLASYWEAFNPIGEGYPEDTEKPFKGSFLQKRAGAQTNLTNAKNSFISAFQDIKSAANGVKSDRSGFFVSSSSGFFDSEMWSDVIKGANFEIKCCDQAIGSLQEPEIDRNAYFPINFDWEDINYVLSNWPTSIVYDGEYYDSIGLNLGRYFSSPVALVSSLLELDSDNEEPVFYLFDSNEEGYMAQISIGAENVPNPDSSGVFFLKLPDVSLGGVIPVDNFPVDDPKTRFDYFNMNWDDFYFGDERDENSEWDQESEGSWEPIYWAEYRVEIEGVIQLTPEGLAQYSGVDPVDYTNDPVTHYSLDPLLIPGAAFESWGHVIQENYEALRYALRDLGDDFDTWGSPFMFLDVSSLYIGPILAEFVWSSFTDEGGTYSNGEYEWTSPGSFWWALMSGGVEKVEIPQR